MKKNIPWLVAMICSSLAFAQPLSSNRIAFITLNGELASINPDGSDMQVLTDGQHRLQFPAWSPDGEKIAAIGADVEGGFIDIFQGSEVSEVYRSAIEPPFYLYWAPDSSKVSFLANRDGGLGMFFASLENESRLFTTGSPFYWQWTADSQNLLLHIGFSGPGSRLSFSSAQHDDLNENLAPPGRFQAPGISASEQYLAYAELDSVRGGQLIIQNNLLQPTTALKREVPHQGLIAFNWSPVEDKLAFISPASEEGSYYGRLQLIDAESGELEPLGQSIALAFFWSPDGRSIAYISLSEKEEEDVAGLAQVVLQPIQRSFFLDLHLIDMKTKTDTFLASFIPNPFFVRQFLPFFDQYALSHQIWSPNSDALVLPIVDANVKPRIAIFGLDGTVTPIADGEMPFWNRR